MEFSAELLLCEIDPWFINFFLQSAIKIIMFRDRVKEMAVNHPDMKASEILANVEMLMDNPGPLGLKDESLMR